MANHEPNAESKSVNNLLIVEPNAESKSVNNLLIVDPNPCGRALINHEDLNISVELEVHRRSDDIIIFSTNTDGTTTSEAKSNPDEANTRISFIDGSNNIEKGLTTHYTELNSTFNKSNSDLGTLGIETIDINFNSSYTPMVKIKFKDIRGQLFEMGDNSPYAFLFRMPYPIFYLTIKGYYGQPVKYALHMIKFSGALDSDNGSFIIDCEFIGYTYAFLSDLLIGILRAVPYTSYGEDEIKNDPSFVTFPELEKKVGELEIHILNYKNKDKKLKALTIFKDLTDRLDVIKSSLEQSTQLNGAKVVFDPNINGDEFVSFNNNDKPLTDADIKTYEEFVLNKIIEYNKFNDDVNSSDYKLNLKDFTLNSSGVYYDSLNLSSFKNNNWDSEKKNLDGTVVDGTVTNGFQGTNDVNKFTKYKKNLNNDDNASVNKIIKNIYNNFVNIINSNAFTIKGNVFNVLDFRFAVQKIEDLKTEIEKARKEAKNKVTEEFVGNVNEFLKNDKSLDGGEGLKFDASIGAFFEVLTKHSDLFLAVMKKIETNIGTEIQNSKSNRKIKTSNDYNLPEYPNSSNTTVDIQLKPFPEYVENIDGVYEDRWLGSNSEFSNFKEVRFINELYEGMLKDKQSQIDALRVVELKNSGWYPINPMDTKAFNGNIKNPWLMIGQDTVIPPIMKLVVQRMSIFLGYSYFNLTASEINKMAIIEANQAFDAISNSLVKTGIIPEGSPDIFIKEQILRWLGTGVGILNTQNAFGELGEKFNLNLIIEGNNYIYSHLVDDSDVFFNSEIPIYVPITQSLSELKNNFNSLGDDNYRNTRNGESDVFFSNLVSDSPINGFIVDNGETFIKIIDSNSYDSSSLTFKTYVNNSPTNIVTEIKVNDDNYSISDHNDIDSGIFKTHEFTKYQHNTAEIPFYYEFYKEGNEVINYFRTEKNKNTKYDTFVDINGERGINPKIGTGQFISVETLVERNKFLKNVVVNFNREGIKLFPELISNIQNNITNYKFEPTFISNLNGIDNSKRYSLFGSDLYYSQTNEGKAFLFLHTIPFAGLDNRKLKSKGLLTSKDLRYFNERAGFIEAPYSWILFMGALLYRLEKNYTGDKTDILKFSNNGNSLIPNIPTLSHTDIKKNNYLLTASYGNGPDLLNADSNLSFKGVFSSFGGGSRSYFEINDIITALPKSVKQQFINEFTKWVDNDNGWKLLRNNLEIFPDGITPLQIQDIWDNPISLDSLRSNVQNNYNVISRDSNISPTSKSRTNFFLDLYDNGDASKNLNNFLLEKKIIINGTYRIWHGLDVTYEPIKFSVSDATDYLTAFYKKFRELNKSVFIDDKQKELNQNIFNTTNVDDIKLGLYKNVKSIYDKWIVGLHKETDSVVTDNLFSKFRFIDRAYSNISSKFKISPRHFIDLLGSSYNTNLYSIIAGILKDNNFDFIALPTFIDFNSTTQVRKVFEPIRFNEALPTQGPQFICMYIGEHSNRLPLGEKESKYKKDDGFFIDGKCIDGKFDVTSDNLPADFKDGNLKIPYFLVNYGDQNQSLFKSYKLDQLEFTETNESLQITEDISNMNRNNSIGQNLFDIYNNRSYSVEVEMLGCAQIQPFMYFQLNNIPMFYGAYTIINTSHHIKANHMTTTFKGVRIRKVKTKIIDDETLFLNLIGNLNEVQREGADLNDLNITITESSTDNEANPDNEAKPDGFTPNTQPWSAVFISYVINKITPFPKVTAHLQYIKAIESSSIYKNMGWEVLHIEKSQFKIGDIIVKPRTGGSHGDIIISKIDGVITVIGGNVSDTVTKKISNYGGEYIAVVRPPEETVNGIINQAILEYEFWGNRKENEANYDPLLFNRLSDYWKIAGITLYHDPKNEIT